GRRPFALTTLVGSTVTLAMVGVACAAPSSGAATTVRPPVPSKQPPAPIFERVVATTTTTSPPIVSSTEAIVAGLDAVLASWIGRAPVSGALVGVAVGSDVVWAGAGGTRPEGGVAVTVGDSVRIASVTKLFTAALVYQYAEQGLINLDAPLPRLRKLPDFPYDLGITVNQLLSHTSGLIDYHGTDIYRSDPAQVDDPLSAIRATLSEPLEVPPGTEHVYSSTNYLILGLLLEQVSGRTYDQLLQRVFLGPLDLDDTVHHPASLGQPNFSTGGIETSIEDLLAIGTAILRDHTGFSEASYNLMTAINATSGAGAGAFGYCPCTIDQAGNAGFFAVGHTGGTTVLAYAKALDMTIAVDLSESLWEPGRWDAVVDLFRSIQALSFTA
ncbi:MAG: serine hydrolase domain-containing protein, partial [Acidimicrobiales bacterium]